MNDDIPTTEEIREYITQIRGKDSSLLDSVKEDMSHRFNKWLISERKRVANFAIEKEQKKIIALLQKTIDNCNESETCEECDITRYHIDLIMNINA